MRILMLSWEYPPHLIGGLGAHVADLIPALAAQGAKVTLITPRARGADAFERVHERAVVYRIGDPIGRPSTNFGDVQHANLTLEKAGHRLWDEVGGFDLIHAHDWLVSFAGEALKQLHKTPLVATMHATERGRGGGHLKDDLAEAINRAEWWLTYEAWRVITTSDYMANELVTFFNLPTDKIAVISNGVNPARFTVKPGEDLAAFRLMWADPDVPLVFFVGRVQYEKGVHLLVEVAHRLLSQGCRAKFVLAGTGSMLDTLRERVATLGIQDSVVLSGYISDSVRDHLYQVADVAVFPSLYEPFGIVALEAMAAGCPVIVSDVGGLGEVVENEETGIKIPANNLDVLESAIRYVLENPGAARARARHAEEHVCREYSWEQIARQTIALYREVIEARARTEWN